MASADGGLGPSGRRAGAVRRALETAAVKVSLREGGVQIRVGAALFNNERDIDRFLEITDG